MVCDGGVDGGEFLQTSHAPEPEHRPLPPSKWLVRILCPVVLPPPRFLPLDRADILQGSTIGAKFVRHEDIGPPMLLQCFLEEFECGLPVTRLRDEAFQHLAFVINSTPQVVLFAIDLHEHLVQTPAPPAGAHALDPPLSDLGGEDRTEPMPPEPDGLVADVDAALMEQVLDIPQREREANVEHHRQADDLLARLEVLEGAGFAHTGTLTNPLPCLKRTSFDRARGVVLDFSCPGKPTDNAFIEAFNGRFRTECLNQHWFMTLADATEKLEAWRRHYNEERPHGAIGNKAPITLTKSGGITSLSP